MKIICASSDGKKLIIQVDESKGFVADLAEQKRYQVKYLASLDPNGRMTDVLPNALPSIPEIMAYKLSE